MVTELDPVAVPAALRERRLDVGLLHDYDVVPVEPDAGLDAVPLLDETVFLAVPPGLRVGADPVRAVRDADWILAGPGTLCHTVTLHVCRTAGFAPRARHHADDFATVLALVAAGQGVSLVPRAGRGAAPGRRTAAPAGHAAAHPDRVPPGRSHSPGCRGVRFRGARRGGAQVAALSSVIARLIRASRWPHVVAQPVRPRTGPMSGAGTGGCVLKVDFAFQNTVVDLDAGHRRSLHAPAASLLDCEYR